MKFCAFADKRMRLDVFREFRNVERVRAGLQVKRNQPMSAMSAPMLR